MAETEESGPASAAGEPEAGTAGASETGTAEASEAGTAEASEAGTAEASETGTAEASEAGTAEAEADGGAPPSAIPPFGPSNDELESSRMPFLEHLRELRIRLRNAIIGLTLGFIVAFVFSQELFVILARPLVETWAEVSLKNPALGKPSLYFGSLVEPFWVYLSVSLWGGIFVASPIIFHQLWLFVAPGLYRHERRYGVAFAASSAILFIGGAVFCYHLVLPAAYRFFLNYSTKNLANLEALGSMATAIALNPLLGMDAYLSFVKKLLLGFGVVFELPLLILFLTLAGAVTPKSLWRFNRWFIVLSFVIAAILTPGPDIISQVLMALPMVVLYNGSIVMALVIGRRRRQAAEAARAAEDAARAAESEG